MCLTLCERRRSSFVLRRTHERIFQNEYPDTDRIVPIKGKVKIQGANSRVDMKDRPLQVARSAHGNLETWQRKEWIVLPAVQCINYKAFKPTNVNCQSPAIRRIF